MASNQPTRRRRLIYMEKATPFKLPKSTRTRCKKKSATKPAVLPQSKYLFRKLWAAETESAAAYHFYCRSCNDLLEVAEDDGICPTCETSNKLKNVKQDGDFFVVLDIGKQLNHIIQMNKPALHEKLSGVARDRQGDASVISDITEAEAYVKLQSSGTLQGSDLTLTVNTDGSPVFTSSGASVWPIQFTANELPVPQRFKVSALAGLWFGRGHPNMTLFLGKFVEGVTTMEPVLWQHEGTRHSSRAYVLCCCVDAPARSSVQNIVLFNGYYGCPWCLIKGDYIDGSLRFLSFDDAPERTSAGVLRDMKLALEMSMVINGYKGPSPAVNLPHYDLVWGFTVEYMHAVLLGVPRQITEQLLSSANSSERYYIGSPCLAAAVDKRLLAIKPPHSFTRLPRSLGTRGNWKASEWRHWLLFYCLPCTLGILHPRYWSHLAKVVEGVHLLLREELTSSSIDHAVEFLLDKTQPVVSSDDVRDFSGVVEDDKVYQVYWAGDARTKGSFYDAKVLYMAVTVMGNLAIVLLLVCIVSSYGAFPKHYPFPDFGSDIPCDLPYDLGKCHSNSSPPLVTASPGHPYKPTSQRNLLLPNLPASETLHECPVASVQKRRLESILRPNTPMFTEVPGKANVLLHRIGTGDARLLRCNPRPLSVLKRALLDAFLQEMLDTGAVSESQTPRASPAVLPPKKDGSARLCVDYRKLNAITVRDSPDSTQYWANIRFDVAKNEWPNNAPQWPN
ncbi:hypothetical protein ISCGN_026901 [Ixodes scapularis]